MNPGTSDKWRLDSEVSCCSLKTVLCLSLFVPVFIPLKLFFLFRFSNFMCSRVLLACVDVHHSVPGALEGQKWVSSPLGLELTVASRNGGGRN